MVSQQPIHLSKETAVFTDNKFRSNSQGRGRQAKVRRSAIGYANVTATLAIVLSMSGGALAANHYLLSSTKQISPKVLRALKGNRGPTGRAGAAGAQGKEGGVGKEGKEGKQGAAGPAGSAVAYARVEANGTLDQAHSKNITSAEQSKTAGVYCVTPSVPVRSVTVSEPHVGGDNGAYAQANITALDGVNLNCASQPAYVITWKAGGTTLESHPVYLVFN
jgi:hypothetical protein